MKLLASLLLIFSLSSAHADEAACRQVLGLCDGALKAEQGVTSLQKQIIADQGKVISDQAAQIKGESLWKPVAIAGVTVSVLETLILILRK